MDSNRCVASGCGLFTRRCAGAGADYRGSANNGPGQAGGCAFNSAFSGAFSGAECRRRGCIAGGQTGCVPIRRGCRGGTLAWCLSFTVGRSRWCACLGREASQRQLDDRRGTGQ
jgi:hypothetical protein